MLAEEERRERRREYQKKYHDKNRNTRNNNCKARYWADGHERLRQRKETTMVLNGFELPVGPGVSWINKDLRGVNLRGVDLRGADLTRCNLTGADLTRCNLADARLEGALLVDAMLHQTVLTGADLTEADFTGAVITECDLTGVKDRGAIFRKARVRAVRIGEENPRNRSFRLAYLAGLGRQSRAAPRTIDLTIGGE